MKIISRLCAKILVMLVLKRKASNTLGVKMGERLFTVNVDEFIPAAEQLEIWRKAYNESTL